MKSCLIVERYVYSNTFVFFVEGGVHCLTSVVLLSVLFVHFYLNGVFHTGVLGVRKVLVGLTKGTGMTRA